MANPIIKIKRGATAPVATLNAGEFAIDQVAKNLYLGVEVGGVVTNEIVGGNGTFATHTDVATAVSAGTGSLGTMSTQDADAVAITGGTIDNTTIGATTPSTGAFTTLTATTLDGNINAFTAVIDQLALTNSFIDSSAIGANTPSTGVFTTLGVTSDITMSGAGTIDMNAGRITNLSAPINANDAVRKTDLASAISDLGSVFHYVGNLYDFPGGLASPMVTDLETLADKTTGAYYRVDVAGTYTAGASSFAARVGDAFVKTSTGWQKLDNVDVVVSGTTDEITVIGNEDTGYVVSLTTGTPNSWKDGVDGDLTAIDGRANDLETKTQNITAIAGETYVAGILTSQELWVGPSSTDAVKLLNPVAGPASVEAPAGKELVIKNGAGNTAITVIASGSGRVDFAYDVNVAAILDASVLSAGSASFGSMGVSSSANFNGGINVNTGNLVGNGTNEITDFIIDGGSY